METRKLFLIVLGLAIMLVGGVGAGMISVNLAEGDQGAPRANQTLLANEVAGLTGYESANWNNVQLDATGKALVDDTGTPTGSVINFAVSNGWGDDTPGENPVGSGKVARGYFDDGETSAGIGVDIEVTNVPYSNYSVILLLSCDWLPGNWGTFTVNGVAQDGPLKIRWGDVGAFEEGVNALFFEGQSGSTLNIHCPLKAGDDRGTIAGFQIVTPSAKATLVAPANNATAVPVDQVFEWESSVLYTASGYDIYMDPNLFNLDTALVVGNHPSTTLSGVALDYDTSYLWRVDSIDPNDGNPVTYTGNVWAFTTDIHPALKDRTGRDDLAGDVSLMNPSFESITVTGDDGEAWGYDIDYWYEGYANYWQCFWELGSAIGLVSDLDRWAGTETNGTFYQAIGTVTPGAEYEVRMLIGNRGGNSFGTGSASLFAGADNAGQGIMLESFATELDTASFTMADGINVSTNVNEAGVLLSIPADAAGGEILWLRIKSESGKDYFDNIRLYKPIDSRAAWGPSPAVGDSDVGVLAGTLLGWQGSVDVNDDYAPLAVYDFAVYADTDKDGILEYMGNTGGATELTVTVPSDSTILWRVDAIIGAETIQGRTWSFDTELLLATIIEQPVSVVIDDGDEASFSVSVDSYSLESYTWYKVVPGGDDAEVGSGSTYSISSATLAAGDEGAYYCKVNNSAGDTYTSNAYLTVKRRMGYWSFDDTLVSEDNAAHAGVVASSNFTDDAVSGKAWQFYGDPNMIIVDNSVEDFNFYPQGYSISAWIKTTQADDEWGAYVAKHTRDDWMGIILTHSGGGNAVTTVRESFNDLSSQDVTVNDGLWHHIVGTYNAVTGMGEIYVDGEYNNQAGPNLDALTLHDEPLFFGGETTGGDISYVGLLDEVKIWNYPLDGFEVADEYFRIRPGADTICVDPVELEFDVSGPEGIPDCEVGFYDFAAFALKWLDCNRMPADRCF